MRPGRQPPPFPTTSLPGSAGKIEIMRWRHKAGYLLQHQDDATINSQPMTVWEPKRVYRQYWRVRHSCNRWKAYVMVRKKHKKGLVRERMIGSFATREEAELASIDHYQRFGVEVID